jgi:hypothetical protein
MVEHEWIIELAPFLMRSLPGYSPDSSAVTLLEDQVAHDLCLEGAAYVLQLVVQVVSPSGNFAPMRLYRLCRKYFRVVDPTSAAASSVLVFGAALGPSYRVKTLHIPSASDPKAVAGFISMSIDSGACFIQGSLDDALILLSQLLHGKLPIAPRVAAPAHVSSGRISSSIDYASPILDGGLNTRAALKKHFEPVMEWLGRLMGIILRLGGSLAHLEIHNETVMLLADEGEFPIPDAVPYGMVEAAFFVRRGAREVLGYLGFSLLQDADLLERFGH